MIKHYQWEFITKGCAKQVKTRISHLDQTCFCTKTYCDQRNILCFCTNVYKDIFSFECLKRDVHFCLFPPMKGFIYHSPGSKLVLIAKLFVECFGSWLSRLCSLYADNLYLHIMSSFCIEWKWSIKPNKLFEWMAINCTMK